MANQRFEWLHVDFEKEHRPFYLDACGFEPTAAGLMALREPDPKGLPVLT